MNIDSFFSIGKSHQVCEDYVMSGSDPIPYIIMADGCSSSYDTDIGARILVKCAKKIIIDDFKYSNPRTFKLPSYFEFGYRILSSAVNICTLLGLPTACLNSTLGICAIINGSIYTYLYGDGYIICVDKNNTITFAEIKFENEMPYYLPYWLGSVVSDQYLQNQSNNNECMTISWHDYFHDNSYETFICNYDDQINISLGHIRQYKCVGISTDGIDKLYTVQNGQGVDVKEVIKSITSFQSVTGEFVKRRVKRMLKTYLANGVANRDDIGIGFFHFD